VVVADFDDPASIAAALHGARRAYLVTPSSERAEAQQRRFADLAVQAGVGHLVVLSQLGADEQSPVRFLRYHAAVERHIRDLGIAYTFLRPNLFFQGLLAFAATIAADGRFYAPIGDATISAVDVRDIAAVAAAALTEPGHDGATYTLTGPAPITHAEIAGALTSALGRDITFIDVPPDVFAERACRASCRPGRSKASWRTTRTTGAGRRRQFPLRSLRSPAGPQSTSSNSHTTTPPRSPSKPSSVPAVLEPISLAAAVPL
jgi:uncharacterized protein YbjT (DUF2867 family)